MTDPKIPDTIQPARTHRDVAVSRLRLAPENTRPPSRLPN
ncbi:hypothetical protein SEA_JAMIE19_54 [Mycobacterium phage Jamie19]|uniref:Uncharacterized protein n=6 Tax=Charlievirus TaxID=1623280 RepID=A0A1I9SCC3_9CAUD|nr:hypothetical protein CL59_gp60 [Mycobacterium phage Redi]YP_010052397.1 hypothetical protein KD935_gp54 [Mycobacterium phage Jamie19]AOZ64500.1 hypothetical protein SEA_PHANCYPHIN_60 [Mycobacterium phage PhancyPhin]QBI98083.1 hypothetical protein SEA_SPONGEBOB_54 [Mycobacterium phage SpongeBob]QBI99199.1 hypothetical protein SEA_NENAE_60 [Mycobacterium phage Nenae]QBI99267.1 hypothetical protein SEA_PURGAMENSTRIS_60 [Mycobacterium phage Purgamenstris]QBI99949.1 hypothetical protein SEA_SHR